MTTTALLLSQPAVCFYRVVPHHLPVVHDRAGGVADRARSAAYDHRAPRMPPGVRLLAQDLRRGVRHGRGVRNRARLRVRHQLERTVATVRSDPGTTAVV